jgi:phenylpropionate dioxygenase-like ring-hydroxylating dioxygenase large terminal subunit
MARELPRWAAKYPELGTGSLPIDPYVESEYLDFEREHIFRTAWLNVGRIDDVPQSGSYFVREIELLNASVLVTHASDGVIRAFHNVCSHRQNKLVWKSRGTCRGYLSCQFHGWTYDLEGKLRGVLDEENFHALDKDRLGLTPLATGVWEGFIFVNFQAEPDETLEEYLSGLIFRSAGSTSSRSRSATTSTTARTGRSRSTRRTRSTTCRCSVPCTEPSATSSRRTRKAARASTSSSASVGIPSTRPT